MDKSKFIRNVAEPTFTRIGTLTAALLVGYGLSAVHEATVAQAVTLVSGLAFDLVLRKFLGR